MPLSLKLIQISRYLSNLPWKKILKGTFLMTLAPYMILSLFVASDKIPLLEAIYIGAPMFAIAIIFVTPYITNLSELTSYVRRLSLDQKAEAPNLSFLNNVEELQQAVDELHSSWGRRKSQLEGAVTESKVLIDSLPDLLIMLDDNMNIVKTNRTTMILLGGNDSEKLHEIIKTTVIAKLIDEVVKDGKGRNSEFTYIIDGASKDFYVNIEKLPFSSPGGISLIIVIRDITELKRTEKTFADFVANASHEIRTPLTSIVGFIETLQSGAKDEPEARDKFLSIMAEQAERMARLVKDLLSLSEIEMSLKTSPSSRININDILDTVILQSTWSAKQRNMQIVFECEEDLPIITGDANQLSQVFENLISNAIKYASPDTKINVKAEVQENNGQSHHHGINKILSISVEDSGEGISPQHIPRLTERFYRVDKARSRKIGGTGLGLSIVKHIIQRHGGDFVIKSEVGRGSVFTVFLPIS